MRLGKTIIALLFASLACLAQEPYHNSLVWRQQQRKLGKPMTPEEQASVGLAYRWVASDAATNTPLAGIVDRIQNSLWTNGASGLRPTNRSGSGIWFDSTHYFTNDWPWSFPFTNITIGFILQVVNCGSVGGIHPALLCNRAPADAGTIPSSYSFPDGQWSLNLQEGASTFPFTTGRFTLTNNLIDMVFDQGVTNLGQRYTAYYSNAIYGTTLSRAAWGAYIAGRETNNAPYCLMHNFMRDSGPRVWLQEMWIWTNGNAFGFPSITLSNFHKYGTNLYGYGP